MLMLLAASEDIPAELRSNIAKLMMKGFAGLIYLFIWLGCCFFVFCFKIEFDSILDLAKIAGTNISGGQSVRNPWPIIGGLFYFS